MKLALGGLYVVLALLALAVYEHTHDFWAAIASSALAVASIAYLGSILREYKGAKRQ